LLFIYSIKFNKSKISLAMLLFILFMTRPPILFIIGLGYLASLIKFRNLKPILISLTTAILVLVALWHVEIGGFGLKHVMNDMYFGLTPRGSDEIRFANGIHFFQFILSNPLTLIKPMFFGFVDVVMNPNPWNFMYLVDPYSSNLGFSYYWEQIGNYLSSFNWYLLLLIIFPSIMVLLVQNNLFIVLKKNKIYVFIYLMNLLYMGLRADLRYKFIFMPILMILGFEIFNHVKMSKNVRLNYIFLFIIMFISLAIFDSFFWGRTTISIV